MENDSSVWIHENSRTMLYTKSIVSKQLLELGEVVLVCVKESAEAMLQRRGGTKDFSEVLPGSR